MFSLLADTMAGKIKTLARLDYRYTERSAVTTWREQGSLRAMRGERDGGVHSRPTGRPLRADVTSRPHAPAPFVPAGSASERCPTGAGARLLQPVASRGWGRPGQVRTAGPPRDLALHDRMSSAAIPHTAEHMLG